MNQEDENVSTESMRKASQVRGREDIAYAMLDYIDRRQEELVPHLVSAEKGEVKMPLTRDELEFLTGSVEELAFWSEQIRSRRQVLFGELEKLT